MATEKERVFFAKHILSAVGEKAKDLPADQQLNGFLSMRGHKYNNELMVIGQAVNGWGDAFDPHELNEESCDRLADNVFNSVTDNPMAWVLKPVKKRDYIPMGKPFWQVIHNIVSKLEIAKEDEANWPLYLVWSNLYKISPSPKGNPGETLKDIQRDGCIGLLRLELDTYRPKRVLFITGRSWADPFFERFSEDVLQSPRLRVEDDKDLGAKYVERAGQIVLEDRTRICFVVASRPEWKTREQREQWVNEVMQAFGR